MEKNKIRMFIKEKVDQGYSEEKLYNLFVAENTFENERKKDSRLSDVTLDEYKVEVKEYLEEYRSYKYINDFAGIHIDYNNEYKPCMEYGSSWKEYKKKIQKDLGTEAAETIEKNCAWILRHLKKETRGTEPIKGLVFGSVQSGKTANMVGLISMAADYNWNFFIILSGMIDNLRQQTQSRFETDLCTTDGIEWKVLDFSDRKSHNNAILQLNQLDKASYSSRYVTVCLKNKKRLEKLIKWIYKQGKRVENLRILIIDDEADQASINTAEITPKEQQNRKTINKLICNLVNGKTVNGENPSDTIQAINYISYTATPYANVLNESGRESLYPKDFICTLPDSPWYFGIRVVFGTDSKSCPGFPIIRNIPSAKDKTELNPCLKDAICWFLCAVAVLRQEGYTDNISMLIHTSRKQEDHFPLHDDIRNWLIKDLNEILERCKAVYTKEAKAVTVEDLHRANICYPVDSVKLNMPAFDNICEEIKLLITNITNIVAEEGEPKYSQGLHLCVDNSSAQKKADENVYLRILYPDEEKKKEIGKAPAFLVIGGNTLSRGLTIEGLICTYFSRKVNQADTLMQMARWFGYRKKYELLQRIWLTDETYNRYKALALVDEALKQEIKIFMEKELSPAKMGPRVKTIQDDINFKITAKNKSQSAEYEDFDFSGTTIETTEFDKRFLKANIDIAEEFIKELMHVKSPRKSSSGSAYIFDDITYRNIKEKFLAKYKLYENSGSSQKFKYFCEWMDKLEDESLYQNWNIALIDKSNKNTVWEITDKLIVGKVSRSRKNNINKNVIDIGSLRSGRDALCDIPEEKKDQEFKNKKRKGENLTVLRSLYLGEKPLLLIYGIEILASGNDDSSSIEKEFHDIIGISIIIPGASKGKFHPKSLRIKIE